MGRSGFFEPDDVPTSRGDEKVKTTAAPRKLGCDECDLKTKCVTPHMPSFGDGTNGIMVILEHPTQDDDRRGKLLVGDSGRTLRSWFLAADIDLDRCSVVTALECAPGESAPGIAYTACRRFLHRKVTQAQPKVILCLGKGAVDGLLGDRMTGRLAGLTIDDWVGVRAPDQDLKAWVCPTWTPQLYHIMGEDPVVEDHAIQDLRKAAALVDVPVPQHDWRSKIVVVRNPAEATGILTQLRKTATRVAYDWETTGLKPHRRNHQIVSGAFSDGEQSWAMPIHDFLGHPGFPEALQRLLTSPKIAIAAHNGKFECAWARSRLGFWPRLDWDTQIAAHSIHNRKRTNLKFVTYCTFGVAGYDDAIDPYLEAPGPERDRHGANGVNLISRAPIEDVLLYNGADSLFTAWIWRQQEDSVSDHVLRGIRFFVGASVALAKAEFNGICLDQDQAASVQEDLSQRMGVLMGEILSSPELAKWSAAGRGDYRPGAPEDVSALLFEVLGHKPTATTQSGKASVDKNALEAFSHIPAIEKTLQWRKLQKMRDTYVTAFVREAVDGIIHPSFSIANVDTFRSSSSDPNFQNIPKRDKKAAEPIRRLLRPHPGHRLCEYDYKAVEVAISSCYNKDPNLIRYIEDPTTDMHRDVGIELFLRTKETLTKDERSVAKNGFVFPEFYGSYYKQVAPDLWHKMAEETKRHLAANGISSLDEFTVHVRDIEEDFWGSRFPVYAEWKKRVYKQYQTKGFVRGYTGFEYQGPMKRNEVINYGTQGSAFHCLLRTFTRMTQWLEDNNMQSRLMGQIHDAMVLSVHPDEQEAVDRQIWWFGTQEIRRAWSWIVVPLNIEKDVSEIDGDWSKMTACGLLNEKGEFSDYQPE